MHQATPAVVEQASVDVMVGCACVDMVGGECADVTADGDIWSWE